MEVITISVNDLKSIIEETISRNYGEEKSYPKSIKPQVEEDKDLLTLKEAAKFLSLSPATIYSFTCTKSKSPIPFLKRSRRLYFLKTDLIDYLKQGRSLSKRELEAERDIYLSNISTRNKVGRRY